MNDQRGADIEGTVKIFNDLWKNILGSSRRKNPLIYWESPKETFRRKKAIFGYTPWKTRDEKQTGFYAVQYSSGNRLNRIRMVKKMRFSSRRKARARALRWYYQYYQIGDYAPKPKEPERI